MRNLFQVNVEEGRHLWAMVYLLHSYFGSDGREEADELLQRRSGNQDKPRILTTFNEPISDWLSFFMFTTFTDRDGKYQLKSLAESAFDPLSRTCRFMLTEEAHHMFVGQTSVRRVIKRTCELMKEHNTSDVSAYGGINLDVLQKYTNFWYTASLDLFGNEVSSNAASYFASGVKGRADERRYDDHIAKEGIYNMDVLAGDKVKSEEIPLRNAMNEILRDDYIRDCGGVLTKWNAETKEQGIDFTFTLPSRRFHRKVGQWAEAKFNPKGDLITDAEWDRLHGQWLPSTADRVHVQSLMQQVLEPGKMANWIAPPVKGVNDQPIAYEYVKL
jgi:benzoyl-CoA 2,3-dioxygenase component B